MRQLAQERVELGPDIVAPSVHRKEGLLKSSASKPFQRSEVQQDGVSIHKKKKCCWEFPLHIWDNMMS